MRTKSVRFWSQYRSLALAARRLTRPDRARTIDRVFSSLRPRPVWWLGGALCLLACVALARSEPAAAQTAPPPTVEATAVPPPTDVPALPPTAAPPPGDDDEDDEPPPPAPSAEVPTATAPVTRTRRPTRTPRTTATHTATPVVAGALRLTLAQEPVLAAPGGGLTLRVLLTNRDLNPAVDVTVEVTLADELVPGPARTAVGQALAAEGAVRWYIPRLESGATALLELPAVVAAAAGPESRVCVLLLSAASPLEHCIVLRAEPATPSLARAPAPGDSESGASSGEAVPAPDRGGLPPELAWAVLLAGLVALGAWLGLRLRES